MSNIPYRDDRAALRARVEELETELARVRSELERVQREASADVLRARVEKLEGILASVVQARIRCTGFEEDGPLLSWKFRIENTGTAHIRLRDGSTTWFFRRADADRGADIALFNGADEQEFGDQPLIWAGGKSDEYRIKMDLRTWRVRAVFEERGSGPALIARIAPRLRVNFQCETVEYASFVEGFLSR